MSQKNLDLIILPDSNFKCALFFWTEFGWKFIIELSNWSLFLVSVHLNARRNRARAQEFQQSTTNCILNSKNLHNVNLISNIPRKREHFRTQIHLKSYNYGCRFLSGHVCNRSALQGVKRVHWQLRSLRLGLIYIREYFSGFVDVYTERIFGFLTVNTQRLLRELSWWNG